MAIYALGDRVPDIHPDAFVHPDATVIGSVAIGADSSIWPRAVLRGDYGQITIGQRTSIQDGSVIHTTQLQPTVIGDDCVIGHLVHMECCTIEDGCLVGMGAVILNGAHVGAGSLIAAGAVVAQGAVIPPGSLVAGVPGKVRRELSADEVTDNRNNALVYEHLSDLHRNAVE